MSANKTGVLMVCLGNICRSPMAEAVFNHIIQERGLTNSWFADSCGTSNYHIGSNPDSRGRQVLKGHGIEMNHKARQICDEDFKKFSFIFGMDENNIEDIKDFAPKDAKAVIALLGSHDPEGDVIIEDPYYGSGNKGFEKVYNQCLRSINAFLDKNV